MIRAAYAADLRRRWREIIKALVETIVKNDALYLANGPAPLTQQVAPATRFDFATSPDKIPAFMRWFREAVDAALLSGYDPERVAQPNPFIYRTVVKAVERADREVELSGLASRATGADITLPRIVPEALGRTTQILYTRNYEALRGIGENVSRRIAQELTSGVTAGIGPREMARNMTQVVDRIGIVRSTMIARTEVINAYAETSLDRYEQWGVQGVSARVEFSHSNDDRVCQRCIDLGGTVRTTEAARGVIPVHPNCRCTWLPVRLNLNEAVILAMIGTMARSFENVRR
jgi:SPP1 gp7 family putative phage head morphogenesis protein